MKLSEAKGYHERGVEAQILNALVDMTGKRFEDVDRAVTPVIHHGTGNIYVRIAKALDSMNESISLQK